MPVPYLLNGVSRQNTCGIYRLIVNGIPLESCHVT
jgi:hypothetical protein